MEQQNSKGSYEKVYQPKITLAVTDIPSFISQATNAATIKEKFINQFQAVSRQHGHTLSSWHEGV